MFVAQKNDDTLLCGTRKPYVVQLSCSGDGNRTTTHGSRSNPPNNNPSPDNAEEVRAYRAAGGAA